MNLLLIGGLRRSGGSLLARLLDGHPDIYSLPLERKFGFAETIPFEKDFKNCWPDISEALKNRDLETLKKLLYLDQYATLFEKGKFEYGVERTGINYDSFIKQFSEMLSKEKTWTRESLFDAEMESFFKSVTSTYWNGKRKYIVNHCATSVFLPLSSVFDEFKDSIFIYNVRNPLAFYASIKKKAANAGYGQKGFSWHVSREDDLNGMDIWMKKWIEGACSALKAKIIHGQRIMIVRYEDIIDSTEPTMRLICNNMRIPFNPICLTPTIFGDTWSGNSSFGKLEGLSKAPLSEWKTFLTPIEKKHIIDSTYGLMHLLGYASQVDDGGDKVDMAMQSSFELLKLKDFMVDSEIKRKLSALEEENRRLKYRIAGVMKQRKLENFISKGLRLICRR